MYGRNSPQQRSRRSSGYRRPDSRESLTKAGSNVLSTNYKKDLAKCHTMIDNMEKNPMRGFGGMGKGLFGKDFSKGMAGIFGGGGFPGKMLENMDRRMK